MPSVPHLSGSERVRPRRQPVLSRIQCAGPTRAVEFCPRPPNSTARLPVPGPRSAESGSSKRKAAWGDVALCQCDGAVARWSRNRVGLTTGTARRLGAGLGWETRLLRGASPGLGRWRQRDPAPGPWRPISPGGRQLSLRAADRVSRTNGTSPDVSELRQTSPGQDRRRIRYQSRTCAMKDAHDVSENSYTQPYVLACNYFHLKQFLQTRKPENILMCLNEHERQLAHEMETSNIAEVI